MDKSKYIFFLGRYQTNTLSSFDESSSIYEEIKKFNTYFSALGWCAFSKMSLEIIVTANKLYEENQVINAEKYLSQYFLNGELKNFFFKNFLYSNLFKVRIDQIREFIELHFNNRFISSIPLGLIIADGVINEYTKNKGLYANNNNFDIWNSIISEENGFSILIKTICKSRKKVNTTEIEIPYRHGIIHGQDINYNNPLVAGKTLNLLCAVLDWIQYKETEYERKEELNNNQSQLSIIKKHIENQNLIEEIDKWSPRKINIKNGLVKDNLDYLVPINDFINGWKEHNINTISNLLKNAIRTKQIKSYCKSLFLNKKLVSYKYIDIHEKSCVITNVQLEVIWNENDKDRIETLEIVLKYEGEYNAIPSKNNGNWVIVSINDWKLLKN